MLLALGLGAVGYAVLATRFSWARKPLDYATDKAEQGIEEVGQEPVAGGPYRAARPAVD